MSATMRARPTVYSGVQMRSRLEARFAQWLDCVGLPWEYEPLCFAGPDGQYLPDFRIGSSISEAGWYVEVKPTYELALPDALRRMEIILWSQPKSWLQVVIPRPSAAIDSLAFLSVALFKERDGRRYWGVAHPSSFIRHFYTRLYVPPALAEAAPS